MPYVECIVLESLRIFGGRAFTVPHRALRDTWLNGYLIPKVSKKLDKDHKDNEMFRTTCHVDIFY